MKDIIYAQLKDSADVKLKTAETLSDAIEKAARMIIRTYRNGGKTLFVGNGGSAADAQHLAGELVGKFRKERRALPALALTTNSSILTAIGNDYNYESVFSREVEAFADPKKDVLIVISTSGNSPNVLKAVEAAKSRKVKTIAFTGKDGGKLKNMADLAIVIPSEDTQRIQEAHITIGHIICDLVEGSLFG